MTKLSETFDVAIAGAGPAGTSAAIHLALAGKRVLLIESRKFPRSKLCGEFISPECFSHFQRLGVMEAMGSAGGSQITQTVFYTRRGRSVAVASEWFQSETSALGLSRSEMDYMLLLRARSAGVTVLENTHAVGLIKQDGRVIGIKAKSGDQIAEYPALVSIDATGRTRALARYADNSVMTKKQRPMVAFKAHLEGARLADSACEIYFYTNGYGGLSRVEGGRSNLCFIVAAGEVRRHGSDPGLVMREVVMRNSRAAHTLAQARVATPWLSVSLEGFGRRSLSPAKGLITIGDAASFIDPFTGSGMLMALESGQVAAAIVARHLVVPDDYSFESLASDYATEYARTFHSRLRISGLLRRAASVSGRAEAAIVLCGFSSRLSRKLALATRHLPEKALSPSTGS